MSTNRLAEGVCEGRRCSPASTLEPWLLGLAGFLITSAGLLLQEDGRAARRLTELALHISGPGAA